MRVRPRHTLSWFGDFGVAASGDDTDTSTPPSGVTRIQIVQATVTPAGLQIYLEWQAPLTRSAKDWIGIYNPGAPSSPRTLWKYVPKGGTSGGMEFVVPLSGSYEARYFKADGYTKAASAGPISGPGSVNTGDLDIPPPPILPGTPKQKLEAANAIVTLAVGPMPTDPAAIDQWNQDLVAARAAYPAVDEAMSLIEHWSPWRSPRSGGIFDLVKAIGNAVVDGVKFIGNAVIRGIDAVGGAVGSAIKFIGGGRFPTPADYEPENFCVTAWIDPPKFALLSALAAVVFPPALVYIGISIPPNPAGLITLALPQALAKGGPDRAIEKILNPLYNSVKDLAGALLDYAFNGTPALVRWAIKKVAERLPDDILKGILLAASEAADSIVDAIKSANKLKDETFYVGLGDAIAQASSKFFANNQSLRDKLAWIGAAIKGGGAAVAIIVDKGLNGVQQAFKTLAEKVLGTPGDFDNLSERVRAEIANAKAKITDGDKSPVDLFHVLVSNLKSGIAAVADALRKLPFKIGEILGGIVDLLGQLVARAEAFIVGLLDLARRWASGEFNPAPAPAPAPQPTPTPMPSPIPAPAPESSGGLFLIFGAAVAGALVAGPAGAIGGAAAGALLGKGK